MVYYYIITLIFYHIFNSLSTRKREERKYLDGKKISPDFSRESAELSSFLLFAPNSNVSFSIVMPEVAQFGRLSLGIVVEVSIFEACVSITVIAYRNL